MKKTNTYMKGKKNHPSSSLAVKGIRGEAYKRRKESNRPMSDKKKWRDGK